MYNDHFYKLANLENVHVVDTPLGDICGIYSQIDTGYYQVFLNDKMRIGDHEAYDKACEIIMKHHESDQRGITKHVTLNDMKRFNRILDKVKRYERKAMESFLKSIPFTVKLAQK